ncbi:MAG: hypothetical protein ACE5KE_03825 [Methanosarcinales archaeon]
MRKYLAILSLMAILIIPMCVQEEMPKEISGALKEKPIAKEVEKISAKETSQEKSQENIELPIIKLEFADEEAPWAILVETRNKATADFLISQGFKVYTYEEWVLLRDVPFYEEGIILRSEDPVYLMYGARYAKLTNRLLVVAPCGCEINKLEYIAKRHLMKTVILVGEMMCLPEEFSKPALERFLTVIPIDTTADVAREVYKETGRPIGVPMTERKIAPPVNVG